MSASSDAHPDGVREVAVTLFSVPKIGQQARVRLLGEPHGLLTHYVPGSPTICRGDGKCKADLHRTRPQWRGYYPAMVAFKLPKPHWEVRVLEITERLGEVWWGNNLDGQEWLVERIKDGKYEVMVGHFVRQLDPADLPKPCLLDPVLQRVYRLMEVPPSINPQLKTREFRAAIPHHDPFAVQPSVPPAGPPVVPPAGPSTLAEAAEEAIRETKPFGGDPRLASLFVPDGPSSGNNGRRNGRSS